jgi:hypothetical protein
VDDCPLGGGEDRERVLVETFHHTPRPLGELRAAVGYGQLYGPAARRVVAARQKAAVDQRVDSGAHGLGSDAGPTRDLRSGVALMAAAVGSATMMFMRLFGRAGMSLAAVVLLTFGNSTSGGTLPTAYLPGWLRPLSEILPVGVGVRAVQGLSHFNNDGLTAGVCVLAAWILVAAGVLFWLDARGPRRATAD